MNMNGQYTARFLYNSMQSVFKQKKIQKLANLRINKYQQST